uniref:Uncharacterized protein n=1 Tax=Arundo donax TaxID=35708 RepID=A0A0A8Z2F1_ARUDO
MNMSMHKSCIVPITYVDVALVYQNAPVVHSQVDDMNYMSQVWLTIYTL